MERTLNTGPFSAAGAIPGWRSGGVSWPLLNQLLNEPGVLSAGLAHHYIREDVGRLQISMNNWMFGPSRLQPAKITYGGHPKFWT
jgi:hypothetical protein